MITPFRIRVGWPWLRVRQRIWGTARKKHKADDAVVMSKDNSDILNKLEKEFNVSEQDGAEIHWNLATIVQKLLKDKPEEDKLNEIKKRYLRPKNCNQG